MSYNDTAVHYAAMRCAHQQTAAPAVSHAAIYHLWGVYTIQQTSSKLPAKYLHVLMLDVCWIVKTPHFPINHTRTHVLKPVICLRLKLRHKFDANGKNTAAITGP